MDKQVEIETQRKKLKWRDACSLLGCKRSHFYRLVESGRLPAQRYGEKRGIWVYEEDCMEYLEKNSVSPIHVKRRL